MCKKANAAMRHIAICTIILNTLLTSLASGNALTRIKRK